MKQNKNRLLAGAAALCMLLAASALPAEAASSTSFNSSECTESLTNYNHDDILTFVFQKKYDAYNISAHCSGNASYAEVTIQATRPFTYLAADRVLFDQEVYNSTITLPLVNGSRSWLISGDRIKSIAGDVLHVSVRFYNKVNDQIQYIETPAGSSVSFCGCNALDAPSAQELYLSGISTADADYVDVKMTVNRTSDLQSFTASGSYNIRIPLSKNYGCIKLSPDQLNYAAGNVVTLDYVFYDKNGNPVSDFSNETESVVLSNTPGLHPGDLNGDGSLSKADIRCMQEFLSNNPDGSNAPTAGLCLRIADLNHDGRISSKDLTLLKKLVLTDS